MKKYCFVAIIIIISLTACGKKMNTSIKIETKDTTRVLVKIDSMAFEVDTFHVVEKDTKCKKGACSTCDLYYEKIKNPLLPVHDSVNRYIDTFMLKALNGISDKGYKYDLKKIAQDFIEQSHGDENFNESVWDWAHSTTIIRPVTEIISVNSNYVGYTGGAHGIYGMETANFFTINGKRVTLSNLFNDINALNKIAVKYFKKDNGLEEGIDLLDQGWDFTDEDFKLNENFDITSTAITWQFNAYEIGPYVLGAPKVTIPIKDIEKLMKIKFTDIKIQ